MTLKECYDEMQGDYTDVTQRLCSESLVERFALKFLNDPTFESLKEAMTKQDAETVFRAAHTLKGICLNLGFTALYEASAALTERLRDDRTLDDSCDVLYKNICNEYERTILAIKKLDRH